MDVYCGDITCWDLDNVTDSKKTHVKLFPVTQAFPFSILGGFRNFRPIWALFSHYIIIGKWCKWSQNCKIPPISKKEKQKRK